MQFTDDNSIAFSWAKLRFDLFPINSRKLTHIGMIQLQTTKPPFPPHLDCILCTNNLTCMTNRYRLLANIFNWIQYILCHKMPLLTADLTNFTTENVLWNVGTMRAVGYHFHAHRPVNIDTATNILYIWHRKCHFLNILQ